MGKRFFGRSRYLALMIVLVGLVGLLALLIPNSLMRADSVVTFPDPNLEAAIRDAIGKPTGDIYQSDLSTDNGGLTTLNADRRGIVDLTGLEYCTSLTWLYLSQNQISDMSPLVHLTSLVVLYLSQNQISDIPPLANLTNLTFLYLSQNQISDIQSLYDDLWLDSGDWVDLRGNPLNDRSLNVFIPTLLGRGVTVLWDASIDTTPPSVAVVSPPSGFALQDGVTFVASATDSESGVNSVTFSIRDNDGGDGIPIGFEDIPAIQDPATGDWTLWFDTLQLPDGYYVVLVEAIDNAGNATSITDPYAVPYSIRNWAVLELLPATPNNKAGRTMPVKLSLRVAASVDPAQPFVYNEDLTIKILTVKIPPPNILMQTSVFGTGSTNYRIDVPAEKYIVNFQTSKTPQTYLVEIWRTGKNFLVGSFTFKTVK